jgi:prepilin-type N-terminal cleavage/methylation domain-containing protein
MRKEGGFTLIELMIVVLIIGILVAIAVPVFMSSRKNAEKGSCQANQRTVDSAVMQYSVANDGLYPNSFNQIVPTYIKNEPKCATNGATYTWVTPEHEPSYINCSVADHNIH